MRDGGNHHIDQLRAVGVPETALEKLGDADAFRSLGADGRMALLEISALADSPIGLLAEQLLETALEQMIPLPLMIRGKHVVQDYISIGLSLKNHPIGLVRQQ